MRLLSRRGGASWGWGGAPSTVNPSSLQLNGYWPRGSVDVTGNPFTVGVTVTWRGGASAGTSGARDATRFLANLPRLPGGAAFPPPPPDQLSQSYPQFLASQLSVLDQGALASLMSTFVAAGAATWMATFAFTAAPSAQGSVPNNSAIWSDRTRGIFAVAKTTGGASYDVYVSVDGGASTVQVVGLTVGTWYFLAATFDGATLRVYLDGALVGSVASGAMVLTSTPLIGTNSAGTDARIGMVAMGPFVASAATLLGVQGWLAENGGLVD